MQKPNPPPNVRVAERSIMEFLANESDLGFEMRVLHLISNQPFQDFKTAHGGLYYDPLSGKTREYDVRSIVEWKNENSLWPTVRAALAIECKALSKEAPLLVTRIPRRTEEAYHEFLAIEENQGAVDFSNSVENEVSESRYKRNEPVGKRLQQLSVKEGRLVSRDDLFDKWTQCISSAQDLFEEMANSEPVTLACVVPCLVIPDDTLWVADYGADGKLLHVEKTTSCSYFVNKHVREPNGLRQAGMTFTHMEILTLSALRPFLETFLSHQQIMHGWCFKPKIGQPRERPRVLLR